MKLRPSRFGVQALACGRRLPGPSPNKLKLELRIRKIRDVAALPRAGPALLILLLIVFLTPALQTLFVYDRAAILRGEIWRVVTGSLVHFSGRHFVLDFCAIALAGAIMQRRGYQHFGWLCGLASLAVGLSLILFQPQIEVYGGASGIATAAVMFLALNGTLEGGAWRCLCRIAVILILVKIASEFATGRSYVMETQGSGLVLCPISHLAGALAAVVMITGRLLRTGKSALRVVAL